MFITFWLIFGEDGCASWVLSAVEDVFGEVGVGYVSYDDDDGVFDLFPAVGASWLVDVVVVGVFVA